MTQAKTKPHRTTWRAAPALAYAAVCYLLFLYTTVYATGFVGDLVVPKSIDSGAAVSPLWAILVDVALLSLFALQHSVMARPAFKQWWTRVVPRPIERSTYVLLASLALLLLFWQWLPVPETIWNLPNSGGRFLVLALYGLGWLVVVLSTFLIDHADLFGLRQVYEFWKVRERGAPGFKTPALYRLMRHPMMAGFLLAFWVTPHMTIGHLLFSMTMTAYILVGIHLEEHDLLATFGETYERYRQNVRMLAPLPMTADENTDIVRRVVDAGNAGDVAAFQALFDDDFVHHDPAIRDLSGFLRFLGGVHAGVPDGHTTIEDMVAEGNRVSKRWTLRGTQTGALLGVPPTNKPVALQGISIYRIEGGLVKEIWWVTDTLGLLQQVGALPQPEHAGA